MSGFYARDDTKLFEEVTRLLDENAALRQRCETAERRLAYVRAHHCKLAYRWGTPTYKIRFGGDLECGEDALTFEQAIDAVLAAQPTTPDHKESPIKKELPE